MRRAKLELALVLLMAAAFGVCDTFLHAKGPFIVACGVFWAGYIVYRCRKEPGVWRAWGFGAGNLVPASLATAAAVIVGAAGMLLFASRHHGVHLPPAAWLLAILYLPWGLLQQFLMNAMVAGNLVRLLGSAGPASRPPSHTRTGIAVVVAAGLFGLVHMPDPVLTMLTCAAGIVWASIYLRWRNLWPLGVSHVLLGMIAYYAVLRRDPLAEIAAALR